jgi:imidazolonepropionase-like amidohydrolase
MYRSLYERLDQPLYQLVALLIAVLPRLGMTAVPPETPAEVAIVNVNLVPMTGEQVIANTTVLISNGRISAIGPDARIAKPRQARVINAAGKYLIPGLAEMHAHVPGPQATQTYRDDVLLLYAAHGVTLARGMLGAPMHLQLRQELLDHKVLGPRLITAGPSLNGNSAPEVEQARRMVREQKQAGYDFLKLHPGLKREVFIAIAQTAREVGIDFAGHVSADVGVDLALEQGQATIDHLDGYLLRLLPAAIRGNESPDNVGIVNRIDLALLPEVARATRAAGTWMVPTQTLYINLTGTLSAEELDARPEMRYVPARLREQYRNSRRGVVNQGLTSELAEKQLSARRALIRAMHEGGVGMLLGSDAPQIFNVPGFSVHRELQAMVESGLSPYQALRMATVAPAEFFDSRGKYGTLVVGADADLVLLGANPLVEIGNTQKIEGVMARGRWLDRTYLDRELSAVAGHAGQ